MLRIIDDATGRRVTLRLPRGSLLRVQARVPADPPAGDLTAARVLLLADVLARAAELRGLQAFVTQIAVEADAERRADLTHVGELLGIRLPEATAGIPETPHDADFAGHVQVVGPDTAYPGVGVRVGAAALPTALPAFTAEQRIDPLAVRLALLDRPYTEPVNLTASDCHAANATLARWRVRVAAWAEHPSRPIPAGLRAQAQDLLDDDLAIVKILDMLRGLEDEPAVPDGAKFETFAYLDRVLGLHLARDVGY